MCAVLFLQDNVFIPGLIEKTGNSAEDILQFKVEGDSK